MKRAAAQGHKIALNDLGWCYEEGIGGLQHNPKKADIYYKKSALLEFPLGMVNYALSLNEYDP